MTDYVDYGGVNSIPGPIGCADTTMYAFFTRVSHERLQDLCDRMFAVPSGGEFRCTPRLGDVVMISFGTIGQITQTTTPPFDRMGPMHERHACVWLPVRCEGPPGTPENGACLPYVWIDNPISFASGREEYGYAKSYGWANFEGCWPTEDAEKARPESFSLDAYGYESDGDSPGYKRLMDLERWKWRGAVEKEVGEEAREAHDPAQMVSLALQDLDAQDPGRRLLMDRDDDLTEWLAEGVDQILLRQFRTPGSPRVAQTSQVLTAQAKIDEDARGAKAFHARYYGRYKIHARELANQPLMSDLGLEPDSTAWCWRIRMNFGVEAPRVVWSG